MKDNSEKKAVSPLQRLLMEVSMDHLTLFLHQTGLHFSMVRSKRNRGREYRVEIWEEGGLKYPATSVNSIHAALADALAKFLSAEKKDFHSYGA